MTMPLPCEAEQPRSLTHLFRLSNSGGGEAQKPTSLRRPLAAVVAFPNKLVILFCSCNFTQTFRMLRMEKQHQRVELAIAVHGLHTYVYICIHITYLSIYLSIYIHIHMYMYAIF